MEMNPPQELIDVNDALEGEKTEHLEMASYTGLITLAQQLDEDEIVQMLQQNLQSEKKMCGLLEDETPVLFSQQNGWQSHRLSGAVAHKMVRLLAKVHVVIRYTTADLIVRKTAHYIEYSVLAILVCKALLNFKSGIWKSIFYTLVLCMVFAGLDELHQLFIIGRISKPMDVVIDTLGISSGLLILFICCSFNEKFKKMVEK
jgi:VanZ family protein